MAEPNTFQRTRQMAKELLDSKKQKVVPESNTNKKTRVSIKTREANHIKKVGVKTKV